MKDHKVEVWDCFDDRLPKDNEMMSPPPTEAFLESMAEGQLQPIRMGENENDGYFLIYGNRRLKAVRILQQERDGDGKILIVVSHNITRSEGAKQALDENNQRSDNEISDYVMMQLVLDGLEPENQDVKHLAEATRLSRTELQHLQKSWANVPEKAVKAAMEGGMAQSTAKMIGKLDKAGQRKALDLYDKQGGLTANDVKALLYVKKMQINEGMQQKLNKGVMDAGLRQFFKRAELQVVEGYFEAGDIEGAHEELKRLLALEA